MVFAKMSCSSRISSKFFVVFKELYTFNFDEFSSVRSIVFLPLFIFFFLQVCSILLLLILVVVSSNIFPARIFLKFFLFGGLMSLFFFLISFWYALFVVLVSSIKIIFLQYFNFIMFLIPDRDNRFNFQFMNEMFVLA